MATVSEKVHGADADAQRRPADAPPSTATFRARSPRSGSGCSIAWSPAIPPTTSRYAGSSRARCRRRCSSRRGRRSSRVTRSCARASWRSTAGRCSGCRRTRASGSRKSISRRWRPRRAPPRASASVSSRRAPPSTLAPVRSSAWCCCVTRPRSPSFSSPRTRWWPTAGRSASWRARWACCMRRCASARPRRSPRSPSSTATTPPGSSSGCSSGAPRPRSPTGAHSSRAFVLSRSYPTGCDRPCPPPTVRSPPWCCRAS